MLDVDGQWQRKNPDAHETEAKSAGILKAKSVIPGRPAGLRGEACVPVSIPSRTARAVPQFRFHLLYLVEIRHGQFLPRNLAPAHGTDVQEETCECVNYVIIHLLNLAKRRSTGGPRDSHWDAPFYALGEIFAELKALSLGSENMRE